MHEKINKIKVMKLKKKLKVYVVLLNILQLNTVTKNNLSKTKVLNLKKKQKQNL